MSECFRATGNLTDGRRFAQSACAVAETLGEFSLQIVANFYMGTACLFSGDVRRAADLFRKIAHSLEGDRTRERHRLAGFPAVMSRSYLATACAHLGAFDEGITQGLEGVRIAEVLDHPFSLAFACHNLAELYSAKGEHGQAITLAERGLALCHDWNLTLLTPVLTRTLGHAYASSGRAAEGVSWLQRAVTAHESIGRALSPLMLVQLGEAYLLADQVEDARVCADRALTPAREHGERGNEAWALCLLGEVASHHKHPDVATAKTHYGAATALASELGMRPLVARCHLDLGKLYQLTGERERAHEHLIAATTMYRDMSMEFWLQKAEAEMRQLG
jgi:tetratricopeptide (TPR) repeat protein